MELKRRTTMIYGLLAAVWVLVVFWQIQEHVRVKEAAKTELRDNSSTVANFLSAVIRGQRFRGAVFKDRLEGPLEILITGGSITNDINKVQGLVSIVLLNLAGEPLISVGKKIDTNDIALLQNSQDGELWGETNFTVIKPVVGWTIEEATNNPTLLVDTRNDYTNAPPFRGGDRGGPPPDFRQGNFGPPGDFNGGTNLADGSTNNRPPPPRPGGGRGGWGRRPPWYPATQEEIAGRELHGLVLRMSTDQMQSKLLHDLWLRGIIALFAGISVMGVGLAWGNVTKSSDLQIRLVRASELNTHLKAMNLAAAGLAHETRNPLNIIRGMAQMLSKQVNNPDELRDKTRAIMDETDKVTAQLTEFINYSRPREVRRTSLSLNNLVNELVRTLDFDLEEKKIKLETGGEPCTIEADDQLLRQALFNLLINAVQSVGENGHIQVVIRRRNNSEAFIEVRDDGPGVPDGNREEIFKPYFTTQPKGTGLGLAVVQQIVLAHGWEIQCLTNEPKGAVFRISHLKLTS